MKLEYMSDEWVSINSESIMKSHTNSEGVQHGFEHYLEKLIKQNEEIISLLESISETVNLIEN